MSEVPGVDAFLHLEEASQRLLDELTTLRNETVTFREAHTTMATVGERLGALLDPAAEASRQLGESARALREIGTPELLAGQARHQEQIARVVDLAVAHGEHLSAVDSRLEHAMSAMIAKLDANEQRLRSLDANLLRATQTAATAAANTTRTLKILGYAVGALVLLQVASLAWLLKS